MNAWLLAAMIAAQSVSVGVTMEALARGCREGTYFVKHPGAIAASKMSATAVLTFSLPLMHKRGNRKSANLVAWGALASGVISTTFDLRTLPKCR